MLTDGAQHLQTIFGLRAPEIIYVRPDGYIGLRTQRLDDRGLLDYLDLIYANREAQFPNRERGNKR